MTSVSRLAIAGCAGRMGRALVASALEDSTLSLVGASERAGVPELGLAMSQMVQNAPDDVYIVTAPENAAAHADIWIDFTAPSATLRALEAMRGSEVRVAVIGTTGFTETEYSQLKSFGDRYTIVQAGNFSLGVNLMCALVQRAAETLGPDWDIEILETHHRHKVDAPSGTALMLGDAAAAGRDGALSDLRRSPDDGHTGVRTRGSIGFAVRRSGGVIGEHEVSFGTDEEVLSLTHTALDRSLFAKGALHAAKWALGQPKGFYSMADVLGL